MRKIILASGSPRRKELLATAGLEFEVIVADVDEIIPQNAQPQDVVKSLALQKASAVAEKYPDCVVIGADTVVVNNNVILGKPKSEADAIKMLTALSGRTHSVCTGVAIICGEKIKSFCETTEVEFYSLREDEIISYVRTGEPMDKAGAYGIQGKGCVLVKSIAGDYFNVVGLPVSKVFRELGDYDV
ncbi:MAG: Maf family protein [Clostridia bacterium]|nr:Maf family protein [Clostridia bacterium]